MNMPHLKPCHFPPGEEIPPRRSGQRQDNNAEILAIDVTLCVTQSMTRRSVGALLAAVPLLALSSGKPFLAPTSGGV